MYFQALVFLKFKQYMATVPKITFIFCSYNKADYLDDTLQFLRTHAQADRPVTFLVVDNNSADDSTKVVNRHQPALPKDQNPIPDIKETKQRLSHACNRGTKEAKAPYIVFSDDDIKATDQLIPAWLSFFNNYPNTMAGDGKKDLQFYAPLASWLSYFLLPLLAYYDWGDAIKKYPAAKHPSDCNMGFQKDIFEQVGDLYTGLGRIGKSLKAGEEKKLFNHIRNARHDIYYLPKAFLYHRDGKERLTASYIKKQALGLGQSIKLQLEKGSKAKKFKNTLTGISKLWAFILLIIYYRTVLNLSKALMLVTFRWRVWTGYLKPKA